MTQLNSSARAYHRILKLARTIADLVGSEEIQSVHSAEALHAMQPTEVNVELSHARGFSSGRVKFSRLHVSAFSPLVPATLGT